MGSAPAVSSAHRHSRDRLLLPLAGLGLAIALVWTLAVVLAPTGRNPIFVYNGAFAIVFALYLGASLLVLRRETHPASVERVSTPRLLGLIVGLAVVMRLVLLVSTPALSDDLYRYIWDGRVAAAGIDPYRYAPAAPELASLRDPLWERVNQKTQRTPYPPAAQLVFAATYRLAPDSIKAQQVVATVADLLVIGGLVLLLRRLGLPVERALLYAWHPLPALHFAHSAHHDPLMIAPLLLALALVVPATVDAVEARGRVGSGLALAVAVLVKLVPALVVPVLLRRWRWLGLAAFGLGLAVLSTPYLRAGPTLLGGVGTEAGEAVFNDSLHYLLIRLLAPVTSRAATIASLLSAVALAATALALAWRDRQLADAAGPARATLFLLGLALLLNAVVEPWYLAWILPFLALFLRPNAPGQRHGDSTPAWLPVALTPLLGWWWLSGAVQLTDLTYLSPQAARWWPLIRAVEYGPLFALLGLAASQLWRLRLAPR